MTIDMFTMLPEQRELILFAIDHLLSFIHGELGTEVEKREENPGCK